MADIHVEFKDGTKRDFKELGRAGGSWYNSVKYEGEFAIITDEWGNTTAFPAADIKEIRTTPGRG